MSLDVEVVHDPRPLQRLLRHMLPNANIKVKMLHKQVVLSGSVKTPAQAQKAVKVAENFMKSYGGKASVINTLKVTGKDQVMIKVKLAEVKRDVLKQFRINFQNISFIKGNFSHVASLGFPYSLGGFLGNAGLRSSYRSGTTRVNGILQALERDGLMRLLAEPTLTAISGESASFHAGGEMPVVTSVDDGTVGYSHKPFGVMLNFSPKVLDEGRISMKVKVEVSEVSGRFSIPVQDNLAIPGFESRKAETVVELPSGGTLAIAGMISEHTRQSVDGIPGLKRLPIIGALFRSRDFQSSQTELVVLTTPYIVNPVNEKKLRTPIDRLNAATDMQAVMLGRLHRVYGSPVKARENNLNYHGNVGFILD
jgi:pilus assembly protein CpaC